jgi:hypothetical protein
MNEPSELPPSRRLSAPRASVVGVLAVGLLTGLAWLSGLLPAETPEFVVSGALLACIAGALGCVFHTRAARPPGGGPQAAQKFQIALILDFLVKVVGLVVGLGVLWLAEVKFPALAAFGVSYAAASMVFQLASTAMLARDLASRGPAPSPPDPLDRVSSKQDA